MTLPLFLLSIFSISIGFLTKDLFIGFGTHFWGSSIFILPNNYLLNDIEFISLFAKQLPFILTLMGAFLAFFIYSLELDSYFNFKKSSQYKILYNFLSRKWYFDRIYNQFISQNILYSSYFFFYKDIDRGIIEIFGPSGITNLTISSHIYIKDFQSGNNFHYLFIFLISILFIIIGSLLTL